MTQTPAAKAFLMFGALIIGGALTILVLLVLGYGKTSETTENTGDTKELARQIAAVAARIEDCSSEGGKCYRENQARTGAAIQTILESFKQQLDPHRLRNEAENLCLLYAFAGPPPNRVADKPLEEAVAYYQQCVLDRSGGTEPPPLPPNPYVTTTTTTTTTKRGGVG